MTEQSHMYNSTLQFLSYIIVFSSIPTKPSCHAGRAKQINQLEKSEYEKQSVQKTNRYNLKKNVENNVNIISLKRILNFMNLCFTVPMS